MKTVNSFIPEKLEFFRSAYNLLLDYDGSMLEDLSADVLEDLQHFDDYEEHTYYLVNNCSVLVSDFDRIVASFDSVELFYHATMQVISENE